MKKLRTLIAILSLSLAAIFAPFAFGGTAEAATCVLMNNPSAGYQMTSFSVNTGVYPVTIYASGMQLVGFYTTYVGYVAIGYVGHYQVSGGVNLGPNDLVLVPAYDTGYAYGC